MLCPHSLTYTPDCQRKKESKTTTKSNWARAPAAVVGWQDFIHQASIMALNDTTPRYDKPTFMPYEVSEEEEVREALNVNVLRVLSATIGSNQTPKEVFRRCPAFKKVQGKPDFILIDDNRLILAIEVKTKWALSVDDIVETYQDNLKDLAERRASPVSVVDLIKQIYGYMGHNKLQYGVLSTYERTWFLRRPQDNPGELFISEVVMNTATNPTLLQCLVYIMSLARHDPDSSFPPASPSPPVDDYEPPDEKDDDGDSMHHPPKGFSSRSRRVGQGRNRGGAGERGGSSNTGKQRAAGDERSEGVLRLEDFGWDSFDVIDVLGNGRCGTVFGAVLRGEKVAFKLCDLWQYPEYEKEMLTEVKTYMSLEQLQGRTIPKLKGAGYTAGGFFAIATEIAGSPIEVEELSDQERNEIVKALSDIHDHSILHKDICPENILIQRHRDGFKVMFIDFAFSERVSNKEEPKKEMAILKMMLGLRPIIKNGEYMSLHTLFKNACYFHDFGIDKSLSNKQIQETSSRLNQTSYGHER